MQIYPRFKINTRTHHARFKRKKHFICLQSKTDKNIQLTYRKSPNLWNYWSKARSKISPKVQRQSIMQAGAAQIKTENLWLPPLGHGMSVSNFVHRTVRKYSISSLTSTHVKLWKLLRLDLDPYLTLIKRFETSTELHLNFCLSIIWPLPDPYLTPT